MTVTGFGPYQLVEATGQQSQRHDYYRPGAQSRSTVRFEVISCGCRGQTSLTYCMIQADLPAAQASSQNNATYRVYLSVNQRRSREYFALREFHHHKRFVLSGRLIVSDFLPCNHFGWGGFNNQYWAFKGHGYRLSTLGSCAGAFLFMGFLSADVLAKEVSVVHPPDGWRLNFETDIANIRFLEYFPKGSQPELGRK